MHASWWVTILLQLLVAALDGDNAANSTSDAAWLCHGRLGAERVAIECVLENITDSVAVADFVTL